MLDEYFTYSDGTKDRRVWTLKRGADGKYTGTAGDVLGVANGEVKGNAFRWGYTLLLPVDGKTIEVQFDDWMYLMNDKIMLNKADMSKFGFKLGEVTLTFVKRKKHVLRPVLSIKSASSPMNMGASSYLIHSI